MLRPLTMLVAATRTGTSRPGRACSGATISTLRSRPNTATSSPRPVDPGYGGSVRSAARPRPRVGDPPAAGRRERPQDPGGRVGGGRVRGAGASAGPPPRRRPAVDTTSDTREVRCGPAPLGRVERQERHRPRSAPAVEEAHWKRAPPRVRRWAMPTTFDPSTVTSPGPRPAKHTSRDHGDARNGPSCASASTPRSVSARAPRPAEPVEGDADVVRPQPVAVGEHDVDPRRAPRLEEHGSPAAAPAHECHAGCVERCEVGVVVGLRAPEDERGPVDLQDLDRPHRLLGHRPLVEAGGGAGRPRDRPRRRASALLGGRRAARHRSPAPSS
jgi:hypothetical protein